MYNDTITLFNRRKSRSGDTWYPSVIHGVNLNMDKASIVKKYGASSQDNVVLNIRYKPSDEGKLIGEKTWTSPKEWSKQTDDLLPKTLTFNSGQAFDFFYVGEWPTTEPIADNTYTDGFYNYMNDTFDFVFAITAVGMLSAIPHFEIVGK